MVNIPEHVPERVLVTGGAGFIGSHVVDALVSSGRYVTIFDNLSNGNQEWLKSVSENNHIHFIHGELMNFKQVQSSMKSQQQVWHLAGNADIPVGISDTFIDIDSAVYGTRNVLQSMVDEGVQDILFTSSGSVYGSLAQKRVTEESGPLYPLSMYAAGKLAAEAFISSYANLFGIKGWIFRLGNVVGSRMSRGAIHDFITRLSENPSNLIIMGDGQQEKSYFLVEDCIEGMAWILSNVKMKNGNHVDIFNLGNPEMTSVVTIAQRVVNAMRLSNVEFHFTGGKEAWPGDQPVVDLSVEKIAELGWSPKKKSEEAIAIASERMVEYLRFVKV